MKPKLFNKEENPVEKIEQEIHSQRIRSHTNPISKALTKNKRFFNIIHKANYRFRCRSWCKKCIHMRRQYLYNKSHNL